jgi:transcriptional regulator with XRE-family HTH domain
MSTESNKSAIEQHVIDYVTSLRHKNDLRQEDIAIIIGVSRSFVNNVESGAKGAKYNLNHIDKLADHFGLSPKDFLPDKATSYIKK